VGKAAICAWRDLLSQAIVDHNLNIQIWPCSAPIVDLYLPGNLVVVETYPAEIYGHLRLSFSSPHRKSKRRQTDRQSFSKQILSWAEINSLELSPSIKNAILDGFGNCPSGEDQFDALVGLYGMINIIFEESGCVRTTASKASKDRGMDIWTISTRRVR